MSEANENAKFKLIDLIYYYVKVQMKFKQRNSPLPGDCKARGIEVDQKMNNGTACSCVVGVLCVAWIVPIQGAFISLNCDCKEAAIHFTGASRTKIL